MTRIDTQQQPPLSSMSSTVRPPAYPEMVPKGTTSLPPGSTTKTIYLVTRAGPGIRAGRASPAWGPVGSPGVCPGPFVFLSVCVRLSLFLLGLPGHPGAAPHHEMFPFAAFMETRIPEASNTRHGHATEIRWQKSVSALQDCRLDVVLHAPCGTIAPSRSLSVL